MTATNGKTGNETGTGQSKVEKFVTLLGSIRLAIFFLSFIAIASIFGTLVKQQAPPEEYLSRFSTSTYSIIHWIGLDDVFHSWWFLLSMLIFALNLSLCTFRRLISLLKESRPDALPKESSLRGSDFTFLQKGINVERAVALMKGYRAAKVTPLGAFLEKGRVAKYGVLVIHSSILLILLGSFIGFRFGYRGSLNLSVGQSSDMTMTGGSRAVEVPLGFTVRCDDFKVSFYPNGQPKDYVSSLAILEDHGVVAKKDIRVNNPFTYKGISFYQASYGSQAVFRFSINGKNVELKEGSTFRDERLLLMIVQYVESVHQFGPGVQIAYLDDGEPKAVWFLRDVPRLREQTLLGVPIKLQDIKQEQYIGLEVTKDPGLWFVWCGFFFMLLGLYVNFGLYHRRLYVLASDGGILITGTSRKNKEGLRRELRRLKERLNAER